MREINHFHLRKYAEINPSHYSSINERNMERLVIKYKLVTGQQYLPNEKKWKISEFTVQLVPFQCSGYKSFGVQEGPRM